MRTLTLALIGTFALAQTMVDANSQIKNLSPVVAVYRSQCLGSGANWDCQGLQLFKIVLRDGTTLGPYVAIPAQPDLAADAKWRPMPLSAPDPLGPGGVDLKK